MSPTNPNLSQVSRRVPQAPAAGPAQGLCLRDLLAEGATLHATDGLSKALQLFAEGGPGVLPVVEGEVLVGILVEADVLDWLSAHDGQLSRVTGEALRDDDATVLHLMRTRLTVAYAHEPLASVMPLFESRRFKAVPVLDSLDRFQGMLTRSALLAAVTGNLRPASIGGMATPLGVYLTTGHVSAGVGFWGLFLTGVCLSAANWLLMMGVQAAQVYAHVRLPVAAEASVTLFVFLLALRLSPLAGFHAAEHQTVNAIEKGEPLDLDVIAGMPREHPRCGTNLVALLFGVQLLIPLIAREPLWLMPAAVVLLLGWRKVGAVMQRFFTTKPARPYQLASGQRAGVALLQAYAARPAFRANRWLKVWNMGVVQILAGALGTIALLEAVSSLLPGLRGMFQA